MNTGCPIDAPALTDYWLGLLAGSAEAAVEEHLFECERCAERLREVIALARGVRHLAREGALRLVVSEDYIQRAQAEGIRVRRYTIPPGGSVQCTVTAEDNIVVAELQADLSGLNRIDVSFRDEHGIEQFRLSDVPVDSGAGGVLLHESITRLKAAPTNTGLARLIAVDAPGSERVLGEYTFHHTRSLPD